MTDRKRNDPIDHSADTYVGEVAGGVPRPARIRGRLYVFFDQELVNEIEIDRDHFTIGRSMDCDLVIFDKKASRIHAQVSAVGEREILQDLDTPNGTRVNGVRISKKLLDPGDEILIGDTLIRFEE